MRKTLMAAVMVVVPGLVGAQDAVPAAGEKSARIGIINFRRVSEETLIGKSYRAQGKTLIDQIQAEQKKKKAELDKLEAEIQALSDDLTRQASTLTEEAAEVKRQEIVKKNRDRDAYVQDGRAELERMQEKGQAQAQLLDSDLQKKIIEQIEVVAKAQRLDAVLLEGQSVLSITKTYDLTSEVIVKLDDIERARGASAPAANPPTPATK